MGFIHEMVSFNYKQDVLINNMDRVVLKSNAARRDKAKSCIVTCSYAVDDEVKEGQCRRGQEDTHGKVLPFPFGKQLSKYSNVDSKYHVDL